MNRISVYNLYIYEELKKVLDSLLLVLDNQSKPRSEVMFDFFHSEKAKQAYAKAAQKYYDDLKELVDEDFPEKAEFDEILPSDIEDIPNILTPQEMQLEFEETENFIRSNPDTFIGTEFWQSGPGFIQPAQQVEKTKLHTDFSQGQEKTSSKEGLKLKVGFYTDFSRGNKETSSKQGLKASDLEKKYKEFIKSSLYQNAKNIEDEMEKKLLSNQNEFKNAFYSSINAADKIKVAGALFAIFKTGIKDFFKDDNRYEDFLNNFLLKKDLQEAKDFSQNKIAEKYIVLFIRLILEKKLKLDEQDSALVGIVLGSLAKQSSNEEFADIAYGDEINNKFVWENL